MKLAWLVALVVACGNPSQPGQAPAAKSAVDPAASGDKDAWGRQLATALHELDAKAAIRFDSAAFELTFESGEEKGVIGLTNYWDEARQSKQTVDEVAARIHGSYAAASSNRVLPSLRERAVIEVDANLRARLDPKIGGGHATDSVPYQPVGDDLALGLVEDRAESMSWLTTKSLADRSATFDATLERATRDLLARPPPKMTTIRPGTFRFDGDEYGSTHVLLGRLDRGVAVRGAAIAVFTSRETVFVTGSDDSDGLAAVVAATQTEGTKPRAWVPRVLRAAQAGWEPAPELPGLVDLARVGWVADYERQTDVLRKLANDAGSAAEDAFAAKASAIRDKQTGRVVTYATLTQTVDTLLPEVDVVDLALWEHDSAKHIGLVKLASLRAVLGDHFTKTALWPPRYLVTSFPSARELAKLRPATSPLAAQ